MGSDVFNDFEINTSEWMEITIVNHLSYLTMQINVTNV